MPIHTLQRNLDHSIGLEFILTTGVYHPKEGTHRTISGTSTGELFTILYVKVN